MELSVLTTPNSLTSTPLLDPIQAKFSRKSFTTLSGNHSAKSDEAHSHKEECDGDPAGSPPVEWISKRTRRLLDLLLRPPRLFSPSLGIDFSKKSNQQVVHCRGYPIQPDACLFSMDGVLDNVSLTYKILEHYYHELVTGVEGSQMDNLKHDSVFITIVSYLKRVKSSLQYSIDLRPKLSDFKLGDCIGRGACGIVRVVRETVPPHSVYAMKSQYKGAWLHHDPEGSQVLLERTVLAQATAINNPWLPHLHYAFQDDKQLHLVMDYEPGGDLYIYFTKVGHLLDLDMIRFYAVEAIEAVHSLHQMGYIHCDLKPENFAIERSGHLKLIDFGSAIRLNADGKCVCPTMVGTKEYLNIELLRHRDRLHQERLVIGPEYDNWALGVMFYEMIYGKTPFYDEDDEKMINKILNYKKNLKFPPTVTVPQSAIQLIKSLIISPSKRLTYEELINHPFFNGIDFSSIRQTATPPYIPHVGEIEDVSNFSGGCTRVRDEAILDISTDQVFSPSQNKYSICNDFSIHQPNLSLGENEADETVFSKSANNLTLEAGNEENIDPVSPSTNSIDKKRQAIQEAVAVSVDGDVEDIEDVEWEGPSFVLDLPFLGYSYTPGLIAFGDSYKSSNITVRSKCANPSSTSEAGNYSTRSCLYSTVKKSNSDSSAADTLNGGHTTDVQPKSTNQALSEYVKQLQLQNKESEALCQKLASTYRTDHVLQEITQAVRAISEANLDREKSTLIDLNNNVKQLSEDNKRLNNLLQAGQQAQHVVDQVQNVMSRLSNLPNNFTETDLVDLLTTLCPPTLGGESNDQSVMDNPSDNLAGYELIHRMVNFALRQFRQANDRANQICGNLRSTNKDLKQALDESKQQVTHLVDTVDRLIADQRLARDSESNLHNEIQQLKEKLEGARECKRQWHNKYQLYERKYFSILDRFKEEEAKNKEMVVKVDDLKAELMKYISSQLGNAQSNDLLVEKNKIIEGELGHYRDLLNKIKLEHEMKLTELHIQNEQLRLKQQQSSTDRFDREHLMHRMEDAECQVKKLRNENMTLQSELQSVTALCAMESQRASDLKLQFNDANNQRETVEYELRELSLKMERCKASQNHSYMYDQIRHELESTRTELRDAEAKIIMYKKNEETLREENETFKRQLSDIRHEASRVQDQYDHLKSSIELPIKEQKDTDTASVADLQSKLLSLENEYRNLISENGQLKAQTDRLRLNNTQLLAQRDTIRQEALEHSMATLRAKELGETTQQALQNEIYRLTTITEQQGKLINHMRDLLPLEVAKSSDTHTNPDIKERVGKPNHTKPHAKPGAPLISAASAFFNRHRKPRHKLNECNFETSGAASAKNFPKECGRMQKLMSKSRLNFKKNAAVRTKSGTFASTTEILESNFCYTEDDGPMIYDAYSADDIDFGDTLPVRIPSKYHTIKAGDCTSNADSESSCQSTTGSAPVDARILTLPEQRDWQYKENEKNTSKRNPHPGFLKQFSKVFSRAKQSTTHLEPPECASD